MCRLNCIRPRKVSKEKRNEEIDSRTLETSTIREKQRQRGYLSRCVVRHPKPPSPPVAWQTRGRSTAVASPWNKDGGSRCLPLVISSRNGRNDKILLANRLAQCSPLSVTHPRSIVVVDAIRIKSSLEAYGQILRTVISDTMAGDNIGGGECVQSTM